MTGRSAAVTVTWRWRSGGDRKREEAALLSQAWRVLGTRGMRVGRGGFAACDVAPVSDT